MFYAGFTFQLGLTRIMRGGYSNTKLKRMLNGACYCACICAIDFESCGNDIVKFRKYVYAMETYVYTWFAKMKVVLLNLTLHIADCECSTCESSCFLMLFCSFLKFF